MAEVPAPARSESATPDAAGGKRRRLFRDPLHLGGVLVALAAAGVYFAFFAAPPPADPERRQVASFSRVLGAVTVRAPELETWSTAASGQRLRNRDRVRTEPAGGAEIAFDNGNRVEVRPSSEVIVTDPTTALPGGGSAWTVESGEASFELQLRARITTPGATTTAAAQTTGSIQVDPQGTTGVSVFSGQAEVATLGGETIALAANQGVRVDARGQAGPRLNLPAAPSPMAPPRQASIAWREGGAATTLGWSPVEHGASYRVAMDLNVEQAELLLSAALDREGIEGAQLPLSALARGEYYWRVAGVNAEGMAGAFSGVWSFSVSNALPPAAVAPLSILEVTGLGEIVYVTGRAAPGSQVSIEGHPVRVGPDGRFGDYLRRPAGERLSIRATLPDGSEHEERRPIVEAPAGGD